MAQVPDAGWRAALESRIGAIDLALQMITEAVERQRADVVRLDSILGVAKEQVQQLWECARGAE